MSTYLLVHGAWHSGQCWERVVPLLASAGHRVLAPSLTGYGDRAHLLSRDVGLDTHVDDIVRLITEEDLTDVILVGHSYAGLVISSAANRIPDRIAHLVYLDAMVPEDGESAVDVMPITQDLIDSALRSDSGWRVPPAARDAAAHRPVRSHRPGRRRLAAHDPVGPVRCAASSNRSAWTTRPWTPFPGRTSTA